MAVRGAGPPRAPSDVEFVVEALLWMLGIDALVIAGIWGLTRLRRRTLVELERVLVERRDTELYLRLLDNPHLRILFSRKALAALRVQGEKISGGASRAS